MPLPIPFEKNAKLIFILNDVKSGTDPITGEPIFTSTEEIVNVFLERQERKTNQILLEGKNPDNFYVVGRCISPKFLTEKQKKQKIVRCEFLDDKEFNIWKKYKLELRFSPKSFNKSQKIFGDYIEGKVITEN